MGMIQRLKDAITGRNRTTQEIISGLRVNSLCSSYENLFPQVQAYIDEMDVVIPYGVGRNGARLPDSRTPELTLLQDPNDEMDWTSFIDLAFSTWLTESELNIHVWKNGRGKVQGYTILPPNCRTVLAGGDVVFQLYSDNHGMEQLTRDEVMTLRFSRSPRDVDKGVSPAKSVEVYAQLDDLMGQLQKARFENGAIPATITTIRARTRADYESTRKKMEKGYRGAHNKGKTLYIWKQSLDDGSTADEVEIKPISAPNSTLALGELNKIITDRLNKAFRVSNFILGDDASAKYDNAELSQARFVEKCIYPALRRFWSQFQHELDRITGGLGYAISFDLEIPELTERTKTRAEIQNVRSKTLTDLINSGATPQAAITALGLDDEWLPVASGIYSRVLSAGGYTSISNSNTPNSHDHSCGCCSHDHSQNKHASNTESTTDALYTPVWTEDEATEKKIYDALMRLAEQIAAENPDIDVQEIKDAITELLSNTADSGADAGGERIRGLVQGKDIAEEIAIVLENDGYHLSEEFEQSLASRTSDLVDKFEGDTRAIVQNVLTNGQAEGKSAGQIRRELSEALPRGRAEMIARNETVYAFKAGRMENDRYLAQKYDLNIVLVWRNSRDSNVCPICKAMDGQETVLGKAFPDQIKGADGTTLAWEHTRWNDNGLVPNAHVNCRCYFDEVIK